MTLAHQALDLLHRRPGRKRLERARRPDGKSDGERPQDVIAVAKAYRIRFGANPEIALSSNYESTIGQLLIEGTIVAGQLVTAERYLQCVLRYWRLMGIPSPHPRAGDLLMAAKGHSTREDFPDDLAAEIKGRFRDCRRALLDCGRDLLVGSDINRIVYGVVVENWPRQDIGSDDIQNLRCGLNALGRVLR